MIRSIALFAVSLLVLGCGGGGGSSSSDATAPSGDPGGSGSPPTLTFGASPTTVAGGGTSTLTWDSQNADSCEASGGWSGTKAASGSESTGALSQTTTFTLSCSGAGGGAVGHVTVQVGDTSGGPSATLSADPPGVAPGSSTTLSWESQNATSCTASGDWSGSKGPSGAESVGPITDDATYELECSNDNGQSALAMVTVTVRVARLSWTAPTKNVDGTNLTDLDGYKVFYGTESRVYGPPITISDETVTEHVVPDLSPGEYFFALKAFDTDNNESDFSSEVSKTIL